MAKEAGVSLLELMVVCAILTIISVIAIPNIAQINTNYKLDSAGHSVASLLQQARMQAVKSNQPTYSRYDPTTNLAYVTGAPNNAHASGDPDVYIASSLSFQDAGPSNHDQLDAYVGYTSGGGNPLPTVGGTIGFNARGLPCTSNGGNPAVCPSGTTGYEWFVQNTSGGWEAITVTPAGRIKSWRLWMASGGTNSCGYTACWQ
jgi:Tfp pilus assembly protein FimT